MKLLLSKLPALFISIFFVNHLCAQEPGWRKMGSLRGGSVNYLYVDDLNILAAKREGLYKASKTNLAWTKMDGSIYANYTSITFHNGHYIAGTTNLGVQQIDVAGQKSMEISSDPITHINHVFSYGLKLFAATDTGLFYTVNEGLNWTQADNGITNKNILSLIARNNVLFCSTENSVYRSDDEGLSWYKYNNGLLNEPAYTFALYQGELYAGMASGIYHLDGSTWINLTNNLPKKAVRTITFLKDSIYIYVDANAPYCAVIHNGIFEWKKINGLNENNIRSMVFVNDTLVAGDNGNGVYIHEIGSSSWVNKNDGMYPDDHRFYCYASCNGVLYAANIHMGIYASTDTGRNWFTDDQGIYNKIYALAGFENKIYAASTAGIYFKENLSKKWLLMDGAIKYKNISHLIASDSHLYAASGKDVYILTGTTWIKTASSIPETILSIAADDTMIVLKGEKGIYISVDTGKVWVYKDRGNKTVPYVRIHLFKNQIYVPDDLNLYYTEDLGATWESSDICVICSDTFMYTGSYSGVDGFFTLKDTLFSWRDNKAFNNFDKYYQGEYYGGQYWSNFSKGLNIPDNIEGLGNVGNILCLITEYGDNWAIRAYPENFLGIPVEFDKDYIHIYPNPATSHLTIRMNAQEHFATAQLDLYDLHGNLVTSHELREEQTTLDVSGLPAGMYILHLVTAKGTYQQKFIKQ